MDEEPVVDPRDRRLPPTQDEVTAWAERERARRQAWLEGPSQVEKDEWVRRSRRRAAFSIGESRLAPAPDEIEAWAERERKRRQAWAAGPDEAERREWARRHSHRGHAGEPALPPAPEEIEEWARREHQRRQEWLSGPTEAEQAEWSRRQSEGLLAGPMSLVAALEDERDLVTALARELESAARGTLSTLSRVSAAFGSYLMRAGRSWDREPPSPARRSRVPY
jgi:hypothetical protein